MQNSCEYLSTKGFVIFQQEKSFGGSVNSRPALPHPSFPRTATSAAVARTLHAFRLKATLLKMGRCNRQSVLLGHLSVAGAK